MEKRIALLYNIKAGKGRAQKVARWVELRLKSLNHYFESFSNEWPSRLDGFTDAWIVGGDGTVNFFINKYPDCDLPLFIFKGGTGNDFAWKLYKDETLASCLQLALNAVPKKIDAGICNGRLFLNGVGIGFDGEIVKSIHQDKLFFKGHVAYYAAVIRKIIFFSEEELEVNTSEIIWKEKAFMLTVANGSRYGGGFLVAPDAKIDDGLLDVVLIPKISVLDRLKLLPGVGMGKHLRIAKTTRGATITIRSSKKIAAHYDGEAIQTEKFEIKVCPQKFLFRY